MSTVLKRQAPGATDCDLVDFSELAQKARDVLGYNVLKDTQERAVKSQPLLDAMAAAGVMPFTDESVSEYKHTLAKKQSARIEKISYWAARVGAVMAVISFAMCALTAIYAGIAGTTAWLPLGFGFFGVPVGILVFHIGCELGGDDIHRIDAYRKPLECYTKPIPEFAIQSALDIKQHCPDAEFVVEEITVEKVVDPFLIVRLPGDGMPQYYIEVWNEPGFTQERTEG